jgi:hypothetical protein
MRIAIPVLITELLAAVYSLHAKNAHDHLSPHQRAILESTSPPPTEYRFSFDAPGWPQFSDAEKEAQRELGKVEVKGITLEGKRLPYALKQNPKAQ